MRTLFTMPLERNRGWNAFLIQNRNPPQAATPSGCVDRRVSRRTPALAFHIHRWYHPCREQKDVQEPVTLLSPTAILDARRTRAKGGICGDQRGERPRCPAHTGKRPPAIPGWGDHLGRAPVHQATEATGRRQVACRRRI